MEKFFTEVYYKVDENNLSEFHAPLHVRSCGHYSVNNSFRDNPLKKDILELFWGIRGTARMKSGNKIFYLQPKTVFFYLPGDYHDISVESAPLEYYWMTLNGPYVKSLIEQFKIKRNIYQTEDCPVHLFKQLTQHIRTYTIHGEYLAGAAAYQILSMAIAGPIPNQPLFERFQKFLEENFGNPELNMGEIAEHLNIHRSTLNRCITQACGMTPGEYILMFRMQEAYKLLKHSEWSIKEIAGETGFSDPNYFAKVIRRYFGKSPSAIQKGLHS